MITNKTPKMTPEELAVDNLSEMLWEAWKRDQPTKDALCSKWDARIGKWDARIGIGIRSIAKMLREQMSAPAPVPMLLTCPMCTKRHIDEGEFATKGHHTHACQSCGHVWRPALVETVGVRFLPGFKNPTKDLRWYRVTFKDDQVIDAKGVNPSHSECRDFEDGTHCCIRQAYSLREAIKVSEFERQFGGCKKSTAK